MVKVHSVSRLSSKGPTKGPLAQSLKKLSHPKNGTGTYIRHPPQQNCEFYCGQKNLKIWVCDRMVGQKKMPKFVIGWFPTTFDIMSHCSVRKMVHNEYHGIMYLQQKA